MLFFIFIILALHFCEVTSSTTICSQIASNSSIVCSGHGTCNTTSSTCHCDVGWFGDHCSLPFCDESRKVLCNGGTCIGHNICTCVSKRFNESSGECLDGHLLNREWTNSVVCSPVGVNTQRYQLQYQSFKDFSMNEKSRIAWANSTRVAFLNSIDGLASIHLLSHDLKVVEQLELKLGDLIMNAVDLDESRVVYSTCSTSRSNMCSLFAWNRNSLYSKKGVRPEKVVNQLVGVRQLVPIISKQSEWLVLAWISDENYHGSIQFSECSHPVVIPQSMLSFISYPYIAVFRVDPNTLCLVELLATILLVLPESTPERQIDLSNENKPILSAMSYNNGIVVRIDLLDSIVLMPFTTSELFSPEKSYLYRSSVLVLNDLKTPIVVNEKYGVMFTGVLFHDLNSITHGIDSYPLSDISLFCDGGMNNDMIKLWADAGYVYMFIGECTKNGLNLYNKFFIFEGTRMIQNETLDIIFSYEKVVDMYVDHKYQRIHFLFSRSGQVVFNMFLPEYCTFEGIDKKTSTIHPAIRFIPLYVVIGSGVILLFVLVLLGCIWRTYVGARHKRKENELHARLLALELPDTDGSDVESQYSNLKIEMSQLSFKSKLNEGAGGVIFRGSWYDQEVAIKKLKIEDEDAFIHEVSILNRLRHPNVLTLFGYSIDGSGNKYIVTEFINDGSLDVAIYERKCMNYSTKLTYLIGIAQGMCFLHSRGIIHRDLKPQNILVQSGGVCKLCDFGVSKIMDQTLTVGIAYGTWQYMAPEIMTQSSNYSEKCDVYSFGIMMHEVFTLTRPYSKQTETNQFLLGMQVVNGKRPELPDGVFEDHNLDLSVIDFFLATNNSSTKSSQLKDNRNLAISRTVRQYFALCSKCWDNDSTHRPAFSEIIQALKDMQQEWES